MELAMTKDGIRRLIHSPAERTRLHNDGWVEVPAVAAPVQIEEIETKKNDDDAKSDFRKNEDNS